MDGVDVVAEIEVTVWLTAAVDCMTMSGFAGSAATAVDGDVWSVALCGAGGAIGGCIGIGAPFGGPFIFRKVNLKTQQWL